MEGKHEGDGKGLSESWLFVSGKKQIAAEKKSL
jgi:hypothetical protein